MIVLYSCGRLSTIDRTPSAVSVRSVSMAIGAPDRIATGAAGTLPAVTIEAGTDGAPEITIVIADDHAIVRSGLRMLLDNEPDLHVVAEAGT